LGLVQILESTNGNRSIFLSLPMEINLTKFDYSSNTLNYNMVLNFTARNPNKKLNIYVIPSFWT